VRHEAAGESKAVTRPAGAETCPSVHRQQCRARGLSLSKSRPVTKVRAPNRSMTHFTAYTVFNILTARDDDANVARPVRLEPSAE
jgi:hypothetical protein